MFKIIGCVIVFIISMILILTQTGTTKTIGIVLAAFSAICFIGNCIYYSNKNKK